MNIDNNRKNMAEEEQPVNSYGKRPMWHWILLYAAIAIVSYGLFYYFIFAKTTSNNNQVGSYQQKVSPMTTQTVTSENKQKFVDSQDGKSSYKIFPGALSTDAKKALIGFDLKTKDLSSGSTEVTLIAKEQGYTTQTLIVKQGESVYFIEKFGLDDNENAEKDSNLKDDSAVIVDAQGYLVK